MARTAKEKAIAYKMIDNNTWERGMKEMRQIADDPNASFFYSWFKAIAEV